MYKSANKQIEGIFVNGVLDSNLTIYYFVLRISYFG